MNYRRLSSPEKFIVVGIPVMFLIGSIMHFIYEFSGRNLLIGALAPVNESVWEHLKMLLLPLILYWGVYFIFTSKKYNLNPNKWFFGTLISLLTSLSIIPLLFYFYTSAFGIESLIIDILLLFVALLLGQLMGLHIYRHSKGINLNVTIAIIIAIVLVFVLFTFQTPKLPLFRDSATDTYGIL